MISFLLSPLLENSEWYISLTVFAHTSAITALGTKDFKSFKIALFTSSALYLQPHEDEQLVIVIITISSFDVLPVKILVHLKQYKNPLRGGSSRENTLVVCFFFFHPSHPVLHKIAFQKLMAHEYLLPIGFLRFYILE
jgi:hypothetical protein